jgi:hypothetical protein
MADIPSPSAPGFPALCSHGFERIGGMEQLDRAHQGHAKELAAIRFIKGSGCSSKTKFLRRKTSLGAQRDFFYVTTEIG